MSVHRLVCYLFVASWIGGLWQGATNLVLDGYRLLWLVPVTLSTLAVVGLVLIIRRDRRRGVLK